MGMFMLGFAFAIGLAIAVGIIWLVRSGVNVG